MATEYYSSLYEIEQEYIKKEPGNYLNVEIYFNNSGFLNSDIYVLEEESSIPSNIFSGCKSNDCNTQIIIGKKLRVESGVTIIPPYRCRGLVIFSAGSFVNNGTISMTARGANSAGMNIPIISSYKINATGGAGASPRSRSGTNSNAYNGYGGNAPSSGILACGGGGSGATINLNGGGTVSSGAGGAGTSFSGGAGGGGNSQGPGNYIGGRAGSSTGGAGGAGVKNTGNYYASGGAGNPRGNSADSSRGLSNDGNGTGGLMIIVSENITNAGTLISQGVRAPCIISGLSGYTREVTGGSSGGGCIVTISKKITNTGTRSTSGGAAPYGGDGNGGAGGAGANSALTYAEMDLYPKYLDEDLSLFYLKLENLSNLDVYNGQIILGLGNFCISYDLNGERYTFDLSKYYTSEQINTIVQNSSLIQGNGIEIDENNVISIDLSYFINDNTEEDLENKVYSAAKINQLLKDLLNSIHTHDNKEDVLDNFSIDENNNLLFNGDKIQTEITISEKENNIITFEENGLYATINLVTQQQILDMIEGLWRKSNYISADDKQIMTSDGFIFTTSSE